MGELLTTRGRYEEARQELEQALAIDPVAAYLEQLDQTVIAMSEVDLDGIREHVRTEETNQGNLNADALLWQARQLAAAPGPTLSMWLRMARRPRAGLVAAGPPSRPPSTCLSAPRSRVRMVSGRPSSAVSTSR